MYHSRALIQYVTGILNNKSASYQWGGKVFGLKEKYDYTFNGMCCKHNSLRISYQWDKNA